MKKENIFLLEQKNGEWGVKGIRYADSYQTVRKNSDRACLPCVLTIPGTIEGRRITYVADGAFRHGTDANGMGTPVFIRELVLAEGIERIGDSAFSQHFTIGKVSLPSTLTAIGDCAFLGLCNVEKFLLPASLRQVGADAFAETDPGKLFVCRNGKEVPLREADQKEVFGRELIDMEGLEESEPGGTVIFSVKSAARGDAHVVAERSGKERYYTAQAMQEYWRSHPSTVQDMDLYDTFDPAVDLPDDPEQSFSAHEAIRRMPDQMKLSFLAGLTADSFDETDNLCAVEAIRMAAHGRIRLRSWFGDTESGIVDLCQRFVHDFSLYYDPQEDRIAAGAPEYFPEAVKSMKETCDACGMFGGLPLGSAMFTLAARLVWPVIGEQMILESGGNAEWTWHKDADGDEESVVFRASDRTYWRVIPQVCYNLDYGTDCDLRYFYDAFLLLDEI